MGSTFCLYLLNLYQFFPHLIPPYSAHFTTNADDFWTWSIQIFDARAGCQKTFSCLQAHGGGGHSWIPHLTPMHASLFMLASTRGPTCAKPNNGTLCLSLQLLAQSASSLPCTGTFILLCLLICPINNCIHYLQMLTLLLHAYNVCLYCAQWPFSCYSPPLMFMHTSCK